MPKVIAASFLFFNESCDKYTVKYLWLDIYNLWEENEIIY